MVIIILLPQNNCYKIFYLCNNVIRGVHDFDKNRIKSILFEFDFENLKIKLN